MDDWVTVEERGMRDTALGPALRIKISRDDGEPMSWSEVWHAFAESYPGCWAVQVFPPPWALVDDVNYYHLFVLLDEPKGLNIKN